MQMHDFRSIIGSNTDDAEAFTKKFSKTKNIMQLPYNRSGIKIHEPI